MTSVVVANLDRGRNLNFQCLLEVGQLQSFQAIFLDLGGCEERLVPGCWACAWDRWVILGKACPRRRLVVGVIG